MEYKQLLQEYKDAYNQYIKTSELLAKDFQFYLTIHEELYEKIFIQAYAVNKNISFEEIKKQIFQVDFCEEKKLEAIKNSFLKNYFEIEEIKKKNNSLGLFDELACVCQLINKIVQKHWEFFQYKQEEIILSDILQLFLKEVDEAMMLWDSFIYKFEIFSKLFVSSQQSTQDKKSIQVFFQKNPDSETSLNSIKNFMSLLEEISQLIHILEKESLKPLQIQSSQVYLNQICLQLIVAPKHSLALENIVQSLHPDMLAKDGLFKLLQQIFGAEKSKNTRQEKTISYKHQKKLANQAEPTVFKQLRTLHLAAAKMMKEENITIEKGSGKGDRITKTDVIEAKEETTPLEKEVIDGFSKKAVETPLAHEDLSERKLEADFSQVHRADRKIENRKISFIRKKIAELLSVKQNTATLTTFNELNMGTIQKVRAEYKDYFQKAYDIKLGFLSFFVKASCLALKEFPEVNSQLDLEKSQQSIPNYVDLGVAVSSPKGLMVPVIKDADKMGLAQIELEISRLAKKAREGKLQVDEMTGGTFTITNGGVFGSMLSTPILNPPQSAILGMHNIVQRAVVIDGKIEIADIMYLALSYDHRVIDGKEAVSFLVRTRDYLENPVRMLLEL